MSGLHLSPDPVRHVELRPRDPGHWHDLRRCRRAPMELRASQAALDTGPAHGFAVLAGDRRVGEAVLDGILGHSSRNGLAGVWLDDDALYPAAFAALLRFAFDEVGLDRVESACLAQGDPARRALEDLGLDVFDALRVAGAPQGDRVRFAMTAAQWAVRREELLGG